MTSCILKVRTEYSFGKVICSLDKAVDTLSKLKVQAAAIVDNTTWGHAKWHKACLERGIKPILGASCAVAKGNRVLGHMWFLARNRQGLSELYQLLSNSYHHKMPTDDGQINAILISELVQASDNIFIFTGGVCQYDALKEIANTHPSTLKIDVSDDAPISIQMLKTSLAAQLGIETVKINENSCCDAEDIAIARSLKIHQTFNRELKDIQSDISQEKIAEACEVYSLAKGWMLKADEIITIQELFTSAPNPIYLARAQKELDIIHAKGFGSYLKLVASIVQDMKASNIFKGPGRGSSAGSLVCYLLGITDIDPIKHGLMFTRFVDISRTDYPDIDIDIASSDKVLALNLLKDKYGASHVAMVGNVVRYQKRSAIWAIARANDYDAEEILSADESIDYSKYPKLSHVQNLIGHAQHTSIHAGGVLVSDEPLHHYCVIDNEGVAHIDKNDLAYLNLLKIDILSLKTLDLIKGLGGIKWRELDTYNALTWSLISRGYTAGIFQIDGVYVSSLASKAKPKNLAELAEVIALARPAPLNNGTVDRWLRKRKTKLLIYQEDVMKEASHFGALSMTEVNQLRKIISKSHDDSAGLEKLKQAFVNGAVAKGYNMGYAAFKWDEIVSNGKWQMCKAHAYCYALTAYACAYLKANRPGDYAAAYLNLDKDTKDIKSFLQEFILAGGMYRGFDAAFSQLSWSCCGHALYAGFDSLKDIGHFKALELCNKRNQGEISADELSNIPCRYLTRDLFPLYFRYKNYHSGIFLCTQSIPEDALFESVGMVTRCNVYHNRYGLYLSITIRDDVGYVIGYKNLEQNEAEAYSNIMPNTIVKFSGIKLSQGKFSTYLKIRIETLSIIGAKG